MKKLILIASVLAGMTATAYCEPRVLIQRAAAIKLMPSVHRQAEDVYVGLGEDKPIRTRGCTITARGMTAIVESSPSDGRPFLIFFDRDGEEEGRCEIETGKKARRVITAEPKLPIRRQIALAK